MTDIIKARTLNPTIFGCRISVILVVVLLTGGCTSVQKALSFIPGIPDSTKIKARSIELVADWDANSTSGTTVDFLFLKDSSISSSLPTTSGAWFSQRALLVSNHRNSMVVQQSGIAPGAVETLTMPEGYRDAETVIIYADYLKASGQNWYRLPDERHVQVELKHSTIQFSQGSNQEEIETRTSNPILRTKLMAP